MILLGHGEIKGPVSYSIFCYILMNSNSLTFYKLIIPDGSLPTTEHPTVLSVIQSENHTAECIDGSGTALYNLKQLLCLFQKIGPFIIC